MRVYDTPPPAVPMIPVELTDDEWTELEEYLKTELQSALDARKSLEEEWDSNIKQWNARMDRPDKSATDSNIDMQTTFKYGRVEAAKILTEMFRDPGTLFICEKVTKRMNIDVQSYQEFVDFIEGKSNYLRTGILDMRDAQIFGMAVEKVGWETHCQTVVQPMNLSDPAHVRELSEGAVKGTHKILAKYAATNQAMVEKSVVVKEGSWPQRIPPPDYIWPWYCADKETLPWQAHRIWKTKEEMRQAAVNGKFPLEEDPEHPDRTSMESLGEPETTMPHRWDVDYKRMTSQTWNDNPRHYEFCEVYLSRKVGDSEWPVELVAYFERSKGKLLSVWYNWLTESRDPIHVWCREEVDDNICGISLCFRLKRMHQARSGAINIRFDAARRAATTMVMVDSGATDLLRHFPGNILRDGIFPTTADLDKGIKQFQLAYNGELLKEFDEVFDSESAMVVGQNDADMGKDVAQRPTLGGTMKIMEQATLPVDLMRESYSAFVAGLMAAQLARHKQFWPEGIQLFIPEQDGSGKAIDAELKKWPEGVIAENVVIRTRVTTKTINRDVEKQEKFALSKALPELLNYLLQLSQNAVPVLPNGQPNPASQIGWDALVLFASACDDMFKTFKVPPNVRFVPLTAALKLGIDEVNNGLAGKLQQAQAVAQQGQQQLEQLKSALVQQQGAVQQAQLQGFHLGLAFRGHSPGSEGSVLGPGAVPAAGLGAEAGMEGAGAPAGGPMGQ